jgi:gamma-glutamyltranspeptidase / glutathione hydrolase
MVSSRSDIASEVGSQILAEGGNAVDAAVATAFALAVTYPSAGNLGGGGFILLSLANGDVLAQDHRETAPLSAHRDMFIGANGNIDRNLSINSLKASGVPGSVAGLLDALERHGSMDRTRILAPAIKLAEEGFVLNQDLAGQFAENFASFRSHPGSMQVFSKSGEPYVAGDLWRQPDLATVLRRIAEYGRDGFYKGETAALLVAEMERHGGLITLDDLSAYQPVWRTPIHGSYRGHDIWSMPPPSSGGVLLVQMLNMLEPYELKDLGWGSADTLHLLIEAQRRAYADRAEFFGDPDYSQLPLSMLVSKDYARQRFADFDPASAGDSSRIGAGSWPDESPETTHLSVIDNQGNAVALTTTINRSYGSRIVVPGLGFLLNNEMDDFALRPGESGRPTPGPHVNEIQPGKRMLSSMSPTIVKRDGQVVLVTGSPGGVTIINTVLQVILNVIDHGMSAEDAVSKPRIHHQWQPDMVRYETGAIDENALAELRGKGHKGLTGAGFGLGDANTILVRDGIIEGVSDPRNVGGVAGF